MMHETPDEPERWNITVDQDTVLKVILVLITDFDQRITAEWTEVAVYYLSSSQKYIDKTTYPPVIQYLVLSMSTIQSLTTRTYV
jgi:hypothetical protein